MGSEMLTYWILQTVAMLLTAALLPRFEVTNIFGAVLTVVILGFVNASVWDAALFYNIPNSFSSHSLTLLASNGLLFWLLVKLIPGIEIRSIGIALIAPVVFTVLSLLIHEHARDVDWIALARSVLGSVEQFRDRLMSGR